MTVVSWVFDELMVSTSDRQECLLNAMETHCDQYVIRPYQRFGQIDLPENFTDDGPMVVHGSIQFAHRIATDYAAAPAAYYTPERFLVQNYMPKIRRPEWFVNGDYIIMPYACFKDRMSQVFEMFGNPEKLFIRPNSGLKVFTGQPISYRYAESEVSALEQLTAITDSTLICISSAKVIDTEYRYFVVNGRVVAHSQYMSGGEIYPSMDDDVRCRELAEQVAQHEYQLDIAYVVDIGLCENQPKVIEFNSIGTSGWYMADPVAIITNLNDVALKEFNGELTL